MSVDGGDKRADRIASMFDAIAPRYDLLNHLLSGGIDRRWRTRAIDSLELSGREVLLDVCTGTGDVALQATGARRVLGVDFATAMLRIGQQKVRGAAQPGRIVLTRGDATRLPVGTGVVDAVTVAFGIRNVEQPERACEEMARVLRRGGRLAILEFGVPRVPVVRQSYLWYFRYVLPWIGRLVSGHNVAYSYLPASVGRFPEPREFAAMLARAGFAQVQTVPLTFGIVYLYTAVRI